MPHASTSPSLAALAAALGGDCYAGGTRALVPAPGHSPRDRSVSLRLAEGRLLVHSFGAAPWREVLDDLRQRGWIDGENRLLAGGVPPAGARAPEPTAAERVAAARRLWDAAAPIPPGCPAALCLARRGLAGACSPALRAHASVPAAIYRDRGPRRPALLAAVRGADGALCAVEVAYLDLRGRPSALARPPRKIVGGLPAGCAVRLSPAAAGMVVGEGVFTTLSAQRRFGAPGWALLSTSNLRRWRAPAGVRRVLIAADRGPDGERAANLLRAALLAQGLAVEVALPPEGYGDWNDLDQEEAGRKGGSGRPDRGDGPWRPGGN